MKYLLILLLVLTSAFVASASVDDSPIWYKNGNPVPSTDARKSINGFGSAVIITSDADWQKKWNTPPEITPKFSTINKLKIGEKATILIFFANPKLDADGNANVTVDVKIIRPNNQVTDYKGLQGFVGNLPGAVTSTYLTKSVMVFVGEATDPVGEWVIEVTVHDNYRYVSIPLRSKFTLLK